MEHILCSRYRIGTRGIKLDRPSMVPALMEKCSYMLSIQIQLSFSPTHDPLPPTTPVSTSGLISKCLNGRKRPHIPILTWPDATPYEFLYEDLPPWILMWNLVLCPYRIFCGGKKQTGQNKPTDHWEEKDHYIYEFSTMCQAMFWGISSFIWFT